MLFLSELCHKKGCVSREQRDTRQWKPNSNQDKIMRHNKGGIKNLIKFEVKATQ